MGQGRGRRLCGADRLSARWESTHGVCTESRGFRGGRGSDEEESAFAEERPGSRVPSSAHAVRCAPRNRAAEAPGSRGFRRGRVLCLGWREVPSGGDGCALVGGSAFDEVRPGSGYLPRLMLSASLPEIACGGTRFPGFQKVMAVSWLDEVPSMESAPGGRVPSSAHAVRCASRNRLRRHPAPGAFRRRGLSELWGQRNTTVLWPFSMMRCSACHLTARASTTFSTSPPRAVRVSTVMVWSTRSTSCSMMGPSSSSAVT